jgi:putative transposase
MKKQERYLGKRVKRGLFQSSVGKLLNADTQGSIGIALKKYPAILPEIVGSGLVFRPCSINIF